MSAKKQESLMLSYGTHKKKKVSIQGGEESEVGKSVSLPDTFKLAA